MCSREGTAAWAQLEKLYLDTSQCACRLSISWSRVLPQGGAGTAVNAKGLQFYVDLVKELKKAGITPFITLYHW